MKKNIIILLTIISLIILTSCSDTKKKELEKQENLIKKSQDLEKQSINGKISQKEYKKQSENLEQEMIKNSKKLHNQKDVDRIPDRAAKQGFRKIEGLKLNKNESSMDDFSVKLVYNSNDYDELVKEAEKLAEEMNVGESSISPRLSFEKMLKSMPAMTEEMKEKMRESMTGVMFANCDVNKCPDDLKYTKTIMLSKAKNGYKLEVIIQDYQKIKDMTK